jgi:N-alpha-acetyltransferase 15/16, NatA auxiliary subunit
MLRKVFILALVADMYLGFNRLRTASQPAATDDSEVAVIKDDDPEGLKLLAAPDPLERAAKLLIPLQQLRPELLDTWLVSYDVAIRRST